MNLHQAPNNHQLQRDGLNERNCEGRGEDHGGVVGQGQVGKSWNSLKCREEHREGLTASVDVFRKSTTLRNSADI